MAANPQSTQQYLQTLLQKQAVDLNNSSPIDSLNSAQKYAGSIDNNVAQPFDSAHPIVSTLGTALTAGFANMIAKSNSNAQPYTLESINGRPYWQANPAYGNDQQNMLAGMATGMLSGWDKTREAKQKWAEQTQKNNTEIYKSKFETAAKIYADNAKNSAAVLDSLAGVQSKLVPSGQLLTTGNAQADDINAVRKAAGLPLIDNSLGYGTTNDGYKSIGNVTGNTQLRSISQSLVDKVKQDNENTYNKYYNPPAAANNQGNISLKNGVPVNYLQAGVNQNYGTAVPNFIDQTTQKDLMNNAVSSNLTAIKDGTVAHQNSQRIGETNRHNVTTEKQTKLKDSQTNSRGLANVGINKQKANAYGSRVESLNKKDLVIIDKIKNPEKFNPKDYSKDMNETQSILQQATQYHYTPDGANNTANYILNRHQMSAQERKDYRNAIKNGGIVNKIKFEKTGVDPEEAIKVLGVSSKQLPYTQININDGTAMPSNSSEDGM